MSQLLHDAAIIEAAHICYASVYADEAEERGESFPAGARVDLLVERLPDSVQLSIVWRYLGRIEQAWGHDLGLVLYHMGLTKVDEQTTALFHLLMGCMGHGIGLRDDFDGAFDQACVILGMKNGTESPLLFEPTGWRECAEETFIAKRPTTGD